MKYSNDWVLTQKEPTDYILKDFLFFWGHKPSPDGSVSSSCFSQWYDARFDHEGLHYRTAEHWMMAGKARVFDDKEILAEILKAKHPHAAKKLGRKVRNFDPQIWAEKGMEIVIEGNMLKFTQNPKLLDFLLGTGDKILVEASPYDRIWGIGLSATVRGIEDPTIWEGTNFLGYALMEVRDRILRL